MASGATSRANSPPLLRDEGEISATNLFARTRLDCNFAGSDKGSKTVCGCSPDQESCCV